MFKIAEIELGIENTIGITLETGVRVQSDILHVCRKLSFDTFFLVSEFRALYYMFANFSTIRLSP